MPLKVSRSWQIQYLFFFGTNTVVLRKGWLVVGIDYFKGDPVHIHTEEGFDRQGWMNGKRKLAAELVPGWTEAVKAKYG